MFDPFSLVAAFVPVAIDAGKAAVQRWIAPDNVKPLTVAEALQLEQAEVDRLRVLAELDKPSEKISPWVANVRAMMRPTIAVIVTIRWAMTPESVEAALTAQTVWFYLFGERTIRK